MAHSRHVDGARCAGVNCEVNMAEPSSASPGTGVFHLSRRDALKLGVLAGAALYLPLERFAQTEGQDLLQNLPRPFTLDFVRPPDLDLRGTPRGDARANPVEMRMLPVSVSLLGTGRPSTPLWV